MLRTILLTILILNKSYGQMDVTPIGFYEIPSVGLWSRILLVYNDTTYEFVTKTDRGRYPREPESGDRPNWRYNTANKILTLWPGDQLNFSIFIITTFGFVGQRATSEAGHIANTNVASNAAGQ